MKKPDKSKLKKSLINTIYLLIAMFFCIIFQSNTNALVGAVFLVLFMQMIMYYRVHESLFSTKTPSKNVCYNNVMVNKIQLDTKAAPGAIGPYSQAIKAGELVFVSGQLPIDPKTGEFPSSDIVSQTKQSIENIGAILEEVGSSYKDVVKTTVLLANIADFPAMNEVYAQYFGQDVTGSPAPARAAFAVKDLPKGAAVEIEAVAIAN